MLSTHESKWTIPAAGAATHHPSHTGGKNGILILVAVDGWTGRKNGPGGWWLAMWWPDIDRGYVRACVLLLG